MPQAPRGLEVLEYFYGLLARLQWYGNASMNIFFSAPRHRLFMRFFAHT